MLRIRPRQHILAHAGTRQVSACHCEERSDVAIRSPCSTTSQKAVLWANTKKYYEFAQKRIYRCLSLRGCGLPHQCAHWFAMTCKRRVRASECKAVVPGCCQERFLQTPTPGKSLHVVANYVLATAETVFLQHVIARSAATGQSVLLAVQHRRKQYFGRIRKNATNSPKSAFIVAFPCGDADCHTSVRTGSQ